MDEEFAMELADAMDLPDGAYFAMVGELMDGASEDDDDELY